MKKYTTEMLGHDLIAEQQIDSAFGIRIEGKRPMIHDREFGSLNEAKEHLHALAHWHLRGLNDCDGSDHPLCKEFAKA